MILFQGGLFHSGHMCTNGTVADSHHEQNTSHRSWRYMNAVNIDCKLRPLRPLLRRSVYFYAAAKEIEMKTND